MGIEELPNILNLPPLEREKALKEMQEERERKAEFIANELERAMALYKENSKEGEVYFGVTEIIDETGAEEEVVMKGKIVEISDNGDVIFSDGWRLPRWCIKWVAMADEMSEEEIAEAEEKIGK